MKISLFPTVLLIIVTVALGYLAYDMAHSHADPNELLVGIGTGLSVLLTFGCVIKFVDRIEQSKLEKLNCKTPFRK